MPKISIEYTKNLLIDEIKKDLVLEIHKIINKLVSINIENCKTRILQLQDFYVGNGEDYHAFFHVEIRFLEGRNEQLKNQLGKKILELLKKSLENSLNKLKVQITVLIEDLPKRYYFKYPKGTFSPLRKGDV